MISVKKSANFVQPFCQIKLSYIYLYLSDELYYTDIINRVLEIMPKNLNQ